MLYFNTCILTWNCVYIITLFKQGPRFKQGLEIADTELFKTPSELSEHTLHQNQ